MAGLEAMIASLRRLGELAEDAAKRAAPLVQEALRATAAAGRAPDGSPWQAKADGSRPLQHAADHITVRAAGTLVRATLTGPDVWHHFGGGRNPRRPVLPDPGTIPADVADAIRRAADRAFDAAVQS